MRFLRSRKNTTKSCDVRFVLYFTVVNANAKNRKRESEARNENVSKPLRLCIKLTCRILKARNQEVKTAKVAETFVRNRCSRNRNVEKPPCLCVKSMVGHMKRTIELDSTDRL